MAVLAGDMAQTAEIAAACDAAGFDTAWTGEFYARSGVVAVASMAAATERIQVGTGIAYAVGRSPLILANEARGLDEVSGGRLILGVGTGTRRMMSGWHGVDPDGPASRLEELVPLLRRLWRLHEGPVQHEGRFYSLDLQTTAEVDEPLRTDIPVYTAGVNPRMIETAGRVSDGLMGHPIFTRTYVDEVVRPNIAKGAERNDRRAEDVQVVGMVICAVADDPEQARREVAGQIAFYTAPKTYRTVFEVSGFADEAEAIREAFASSDYEAMIAAVSDDMIDAIGAAGTAAEVREQVARREAEFDHVAVYSPSFQLTPERVTENTQALIEACAPRAA